MNTPNKLTILRIILAPLFLLALLLPVSHSYLLAAAVFALASVTDFIDGKLARSRNQITTLGKLLDPLADKMLVTSALLGLMSLGICSVWIVLVILLREFTVTSVRMVALTHGLVMPANIWGKIKTASQMISIVAVLLLGEIVFLGACTHEVLKIVSNALLGITAVLAVVSGIIYIKQAAEKINFFENK